MEKLIIFLSFSYIFLVFSMLLVFVCILLTLHFTAPLSPCKGRIINFLDDEVIVVMY